MEKSNIPVLPLSNRAALIVFGIAIILTGLNYFYFATQISYLLPGFLPAKFFFVDLIGTCFILAGIAIIMNNQVTMLACILLSILLCGLAIVIDLRGFLNKEDDLKYLFADALLKDVALFAGAVIIANFERVKRRRHGHNHHHSPREEKQNTAASA